MTKINKMKCWICGEDGNTGEHLVKASDLRSHFGNVSQEMPLYFHTSKKRNIPVGSLKSKRLKSKGLICNNCNSALTQPYDKAWESLSLYLRSNWDQLHKAGKVNLAKVFPGSVKESMLYVHLYFVKIFGCSIVESGAPINIQAFSQSLLNIEAHKDIFIAFGPCLGEVDHNFAGATPINSVDIDGISAFATWLYMVENIAVNIVFAQKYKAPGVMKNTWHPSSVQKILKLKKWQ